MLPPHRGLHHLALRASDIGAVRQFYVGLLEYEIEREVPGEELWMTMGADSLVFVRGNPTPMDHLGLLVDSAADVHRWERRMREAAVPIVEPTEAFDDGSVGMMCRDPAGYAVQVLWHPRVSPALAP